MQPTISMMKGGETTRVTSDQKGVAGPPTWLSVNFRVLLKRASSSCVRRTEDLSRSSSMNSSCALKGNECQ